MASPAAPKAVTPTLKVGETGKMKHPIGMGKSPQARPPNSGGVMRSVPGKPSPSQSPSSKLTAGQSPSGKPTAGQSPSSKPATGQSGTGKVSVVGQPAASKLSPIHSSPGSKLSLGHSSPRKSIFTKSVGHSGAVKLGPTQSPSKSFFGKALVSGKSPGSRLGQYDLPLALRKTRRPNAGMKRETPVFMDKILSQTKSSKDGKTSQKRKLSQSSPNGSKMGVKHKADYVPPSSKKRKIIRSNRDQDSRNDFYCWVCHKEGSVICCELCPRVYHPKCAKVEKDPEGDWFCPECERATNAECVDSQPKAMSSLTLDQLAKLLMFALKRMKHTGAEPFLKPVNLQQNPGYEEFVFNPMDLSTLEKNIKKRMYGSTEAFLLDAKWILHNCIVFNGSHHKLTNSARMIIKICEYEMKEIEMCPDCYLSASLKREKWFCEVCRDPHKLVWAKLQGFPFWPSKVIREKDGLLDVRFFGQHDRAWVPVSSCFMYSPEIPYHSKKKASGLNTSIMEMELHILNLQKTFGKDSFQYAPFRTPYGKFECLTIDPKDKEKWSVSKMAIGSLINGVTETQLVPSTVKIKTEPVDAKMDDSKSVPSTPEIPQEKPDKAAVLDKDASRVKDIEKGPSLNSSQETEKAESCAVSETTNSAPKDEQSNDESSSKNKEVTPDTLGQKSGPPNVVRRQIFSIMRKRTGGADKVDQPPTKISDTLSAGLSVSNKSDAGNTGSDDSEVSSPSKVPAGVFEVSDESLDVDPEVEAQSPSVQLLGKTHVSKKDLGNRSLAIKLSKVSPRSLGKMGKMSSQGSEEAGEELDVENVVEQKENSKQSTEKDTVVTESKKNSQNSKLTSENSEQVDNVDLREKHTSSQSSASDEADKAAVNATRPTPSISVCQKDNDGVNLNSEKSSKSALETSEKSSPEDIPSTSQSMPTKDKFHIKLGKTIETMKASLGIERLHSVEKETSDSDSSAADSDSDSSEADHSEDSEMEVEEEQGAGAGKKGSETSGGDDAMKGMESSQDASKDHTKTQNVAKDKGTGSQDGDTKKTTSKSDTEKKQLSKDPVVPEPEGAMKSPILDESEDIPGPSTSGKSKVDSDIDLVMSCHTEGSDSDEGDLVIDESRTVNQTNSSQNSRTSSLNTITTKTKDSPSETLDHSDAGKVDIQEDQTPMETDDVILLSDPFERQENDQNEQAQMQPVENTLPTSSASSAQEEETNSKTVENISTSPPKNQPPRDNAAPSNISHLVVDAKNVNSVVHKLVLPPVDPARSPELPLSSFPKIIESLQANKRPVTEISPPTTSAGDNLGSTCADTITNKDNANTVTTKDASNIVTPQDATNPVIVKDTANTVPDKDSAHTSSNVGTTIEPKTTAEDKSSHKKMLYKKYVEKVSTALEDVLDDFSVDMSAGALLMDAKACITDLKQKVQQLTWEREQERLEFKQIMDLAVAEMKECMEAESKIALSNLRSQLEAEKQEEIRKTKTKQWCANCGKDAVFFCCWNTSYCDYPCQQSHWSVHRNSCQQRTLGNNVVQVQQVQNKPQQINVSSTAQTPSTSEIIKIISPAGKSAAEQLRIISNQQANQGSSLAKQPSQQMQMQLRPGSQPSIQQQINQSATQPLHQSLQQQVQQVMPPPPPPQPQPPANTQPMQTLIQYVQAPRMSAPVPVPQLINHHPYTMQGRIVGSGGVRMVRP